MGQVADPPTPTIIEELEAVKRSLLDRVQQVDAEIRKHTPAGPVEAPVVDVPGILARSASGGPRYKTGIGPLDALLTPRADPTRSGLQPGRVVAVAGAPHEGKSVLADQIAFAMARHGFRVLMLVDDEPREDAAERIGQALGFRHAELNAEYPRTLDDVRNSLDGIDISILPDEDVVGTRPTIEDAAHILRSSPSEVGHVLLVDSLHAARSREERDADPPRIRIETRMAVLKALRRQGILVILTAEVSRAAYASKDPAQRTNALAAGAESRAIEFGADLLLFLAAGEDETVTVEVPKNRIGRKRGSFSMRLNPGAARFEGVSDEAVKAEKQIKDAERLGALVSAVVARILEVGNYMSGRDLEAEHLGPRADVRAAIREGVKTGKLVRRPFPKGTGFIYGLPAGPVPVSAEKGVS